MSGFSGVLVKKRLSASSSNHSSSALPYVTEEHSKNLTDSLLLHAFPKSQFGLKAEQKMQRPIGPPESSLNACKNHKRNRIPEGPAIKRRDQIDEGCRSSQAVRIRQDRNEEFTKAIHLIKGTSSRKRFDNKFDSFAESEQPLSRVDFCLSDSIIL